jgi:hypothetical protein
MCKPTEHPANETISKGDIQDFGRLGQFLAFLSLPMFFAVLIFSNVYKRSTVPSVAFGYNLFGAMIGG